MGHKKFMLVMPESHLLSTANVAVVEWEEGRETERVRGVERERPPH